MQTRPDAARLGLPTKEATMRGAVVMTIVVPYQDASEIERRAEQRMLGEPERWSRRTEAILAEIGIETRTQLVSGLRRNPSDGLDSVELLTAVITEADVVAGGPHRARRRALHDAYFGVLQEELLEELDSGEDDEDEDEDEPEGSD